MNILKSKIIKQRWIIGALVIVLVSGLIATGNAIVDLSDEIEGLETLNESMRGHLVEKDARIELLEGQIDVLEKENNE